MNKFRLALIEDDIDMQEVVTAYFRQRDFEVKVFDCPNVFLKDFEQGEKFDIVVSDLLLPSLNGIELTKHLKKADVSLPIILITANQSVDTAIEAIEAGAYDFVVKPLNFPQLNISVQRALHFRQLQNENRDLRMVLNAQQGEIEGIIAKSQAMRSIIEMGRRVANSTATVLIQGESGTGKEVIARVVHNSSVRRDKAFVAINCSAIPDNLLESELFGHTKGAFTGAAEKKLGLFEEADGGTLFLDEIGDLNLHLQAKLLRVLQEKKIKRIGENQYRDIDVRVLAATHKNLKTEVEHGGFREDLYFRLNVIPICIPPLRERKEDILPLAEFFLKRFCLLNQTGYKMLSKEAVEYMVRLPWKGNVRELENAIERAVILSQDPTIDVADLPEISSMFGCEMQQESHSGFRWDFSKDEILPIEELNRRYIQHVLLMNNGAKEATAKMLGIDRKTLYRKLQGFEGQLQ